MLRLELELLHLHTGGVGGGGMITFVALAHMVDATSLTLVVALAPFGGGGGVG